MEIQFLDKKKKKFEILSVHFMIRVLSINLTTHRANLADDKLMMLFLFFPENRFWHFMQIVSYGDNLHGMSNPVFWEKYEKYFRLSSAEIFTQNAKHLTTSKETGSHGTADFLYGMQYKITS